MASALPCCCRVDTNYDDLDSVILCASLLWVGTEKTAAKGRKIDSQQLFCQPDAHYMYNSMQKTAA